MASTKRSRSHPGFFLFYGTQDAAGPPPGLSKKSGCIVLRKSKQGITVTPLISADGCLVAAQIIWNGKTSAVHFNPSDGLSLSQAFIQPLLWFHKCLGMTHVFFRPIPTHIGKLPQPKKSSLKKI